MRYIGLALYACITTLLSGLTLSATATTEMPLSNKTLPAGQTGFVANEPYLLLLEENEGLRNKLAEVETQLENINTQLNELKLQLAMKDEKITSLRQEIGVVSGQAAETGVAEAGGEQTAAVAENTMASDDLAQGKVIYEICAACHSLNAGENKIGPSLHGVFGSKSGAVEGFEYSIFMKMKNIIWDEEAMDQYIKNPTVFVPGARMLTGGIAEAEKRRKLIQYLKEVTK